MEDDTLQPGEEGWVRGDDGELIWVRVGVDGSWTPATPPPLTLPEPGRPIFPEKDE